MTVEETIREQRRAKLAEIAGLGYALYPHRYDYSHELAALAAAYGGRTAEELEAERTPVRVCGRLVALRAHGKAGFAHLAQQGARLQIYVRQDAVPARDFALWKLLDLGDFIGVAGYLFRTRTGELTVHAETLEFLAKDLRPLPEKWHGLQDVERRYRQRYLDLLVNPGAREVFLRRARLIEALRAAFLARGYIEVETPMMQTLAGGAAARPFTTHHHALDLPLYLRIAPELFLKRLVVGGLERVFEINRNFRNEGISTQHNPEFTMLEFYEAYSDYRVLMDWSERLLAEAAEQVTGARAVAYGGETIDFGRCRRLGLRAAVREFWPGEAGPAPSEEELRDPRAEARLAARYNRVAREAPESRYPPVEIPPVAEPGVILTALFEAIAEPELRQPTIIHDFPLAVSPLAKAKPDEPDWVERFEIYAAGMEIANGYSELNDPEEQRRRFALQLERREGGDAEAHAMDEDYVRALEYGMPPTAGEGIGIDRLAMLLTDSASIRDVILFPLLRPREADVGAGNSEPDDRSAPAASR
ncbi:MAG TPA: lysine--tRNA ligase [Terriglobales bacterium]|nr:lysine--tRNA ligase [Terriglobales bacterium]